jgi:hypothetical protein
MGYIGVQPAKGQYRKLTDISSSFNGSLKSFQLSVPPGGANYYIIPSSPQQLMISVGGVIQNPGVDYTTTGSQIIFTTAPAAGLSFFGTFMGDVGNGVSASGVNYIATGTGAVTRTTASKLADTISVKDFGAVGDGVVDDYAAIQAAINYGLTLYQRVIGAIGGTFPVKKAKIIFPPGIYNTSGTLTVNGSSYQCITLEGEGVATIRYTGATGTCIYVRPIDAALPLMTTPVELKNLSIRKDDKIGSSVGLVVERMTNCNFESLNFYGFQYAIQVLGSIDCDFNFKNQAIEFCDYGILVQQKTALGQIIKPNLTRITNAVFISCAAHAILIRKNPDESATNNGAGSVISIEDVNFTSGCSGPAVKIESPGEAPGFGTVHLSRCWFEAHGTNAVYLVGGQATLDQCFITDSGMGVASRQIVLADNTSRIALIDIDAVFFTSPTQNALVSRSDGTVSGLDLQVSTKNIRIKNSGISTVLALPTSAYPVTIGDGSTADTFQCLRTNYIYTTVVTTAVLAAGGGSQAIYDMSTNAGCYRVYAAQADGGIVWRGFADIFFNGVSSSSITGTVNNISFTTTGSVIYVNNTNSSSSIQLNVNVLRVL